MSSHLRLSIPRNLFPAGLSVKTLKAKLTSAILSTSPININLPDLIRVIYQMNGIIYEIPYYKAFCTPHSHPSGPKYSPQDSVLKYP